MLGQLESSFMHLVPMLSFPSDPSLTCSNVQAALRTVDEERLDKFILKGPRPMKKELKEQSVDDNYRDQLITPYLQSSPFASWDHLAGQVLRLEERAALEEVRQFLQPEEGEYSETCL